MIQKYKHIIFYTIHGTVKNRLIKSEYLDASKYALIGATESHDLPIKKKIFIIYKILILLSKCTKYTKYTKYIIKCNF